MKLKYFLIFVICFTLLTNAFSLKQLLDLTTKTNPSLDILKLTRENSYMDRKKTANTLLPNLTLSYTKNEEKADTAGANAMGADLFTLSLSQTYPGLFKVSLLSDKLASLKKQKSDLNYIEGENGIYFKACKYYFNIIKMINTVAVHKQNEFLINELLKVTKINEEAGSGLYSDVLRVEAQKISIQVQLMQSENSLRNQVHELNAFLNGNIQEIVDMMETLMNQEYSEGMMMPSYKFNIQKIDIEKAIKELDNLPQIALLKKDMEIAYKALEIAKSSYLPAVVLTGSKRDVEKTDIPTITDTEYSYSVTLSSPLYDSGDTGLNIKVANNTYKMAKKNYEYQRRLEENKLRSFYRDYLEAVNRLAAVEKASEHADENMRLVKERFEQGSASVIELIDAQVLKSYAKLNEINAFYDERVRLATYYYNINEKDQFWRLADEK
ncbi:MAG: hypothetical protein C0601_10285 [Candidatus Muiribacterium halophilum]|uniref:TolC family protein n=1 Tax=Muiribacterium halophilum TaxID=2053465 RepID=A0A2N5ZCE9_MUIH1|nr:MAG: hypothetical protein C0601_10285 [Candidatus Muirbacterium halophilum]